MKFPFSLGPKAGVGILALFTSALVAACSGGIAGPAAGSPSGAGSPSAKPSDQASAAGSAAASASPSPSASGQGSGQLGMILEVNNGGWQKVIGSTSQKGMVIVLAMPNQPAAKAGLSVGDVVRTMNGVEVTNANIANREIRKLKVGDKVGMDVARKNGSSAKVDLTVEPSQALDLAALMNDGVTKDPNSAVAYFLRAAYGQKDANAAIADYDKAISLKSEFVSAYVQRGTLRENSDPEKAIEDFNKAISLDANYQPAYVNRSVVYSSKKDYDKALQDDQKAVELDPNDPAAYTNLGIGYVNVGKLEDGLNAENKALAIDPLYGPALLYRGLIYRDTAKADLEKASRLVRDEKLRSLAAAALSKMS